MSATWGPDERCEALRRAERDGVDLLVVGGGVTGAGVLRDAASRGLRALLVEREDFASGTSSRSSKMVHGGLRYIGEGQLGTTREACRERDRLFELDPVLVRPVPFLLPAYAGGKIPLWQVRTALWIYAALASFRATSRFEMLDPAAALAFAPALRREGLEGAAVYRDGQVDDARLVLEAIKSARRLGADAANHCELQEFQRGADGCISGARLRDRLHGSTYAVRAKVVVNAAGPAVERVRGLDRRDRVASLRPAKGVHVVLQAPRLQLAGAVTFDAPDGRHLFVIPWDDLVLLGTTDAFSDEIDEPVVTIDEVHYLLGGANAAFPAAGLTTNDICSVYAGVRPLVAPADADAPPSSVSREDRIDEDPSGLISVAGGKLTTFRAMGERIVDRVVTRLPAARRRTLGRSQTARLPLREDAFEPAAFEAELAARFALDAPRAEHLVRAYGADAEALLADAEPALRAPIGASRYTLAEVPWSFRHECPADLCDLLERRMRMALFSPGQGLPQIDAIAAAAARATGWDEQAQREQIEAYAERVRRRYQIAPNALAAPRRTARTAA